jgi:hypothetical protein
VSRASCKTRSKHARHRRQQGGHGGLLRAIAEPARCRGAFPPLLQIGFQFIQARRHFWVQVQLRAAQADPGVPPGGVARLHPQVHFRVTLPTPAGPRVLGNQAPTTEVGMVLGQVGVAPTSERIARLLGDAEQVAVRALLFAVVCSRLIDRAIPRFVASVSPPPAGLAARRSSSRAARGRRVNGCGTARDRATEIYPSRSFSLAPVAVEAESGSRASQPASARPSPPRQPDCQP